MQIQKWNTITQEYAELANSKEKDAYDYEINSPSILALCPKNSKKVLDIGCGNGVFTKVLLKKYKNVEGCDASNNMIKATQKEIAKAHFFIWNLEKFFPKLDRQYDLITARLVLMFVQNLQA